MADELFVWTNPPGLQVPVREQEFRFAVGEPSGASTNSWKAWVDRKGDIYIACRDNFREIKVSLHASGRWRLGLTEEAVRKRPEILPAGVDRAWDKWAPPADHQERVVIAFQLVFPQAALYLRPEDRKNWKPLLFVEPHEGSDVMTVVSTCVSPSADLVTGNPPFGVLGVMKLDGTRTVQVAAHVQRATEFLGLLADTLDRLRRAHAERGARHLPPGTVVTLGGHGPDGVRWLTAVRFWPDAEIASASPGTTNT